MRRVAALALALLAAPLTAGAAPAGGEVVISVDGLRSDRGVIRACLTRNPNAFPDCSGDPLSRSMSASAADAGRLVFSGLPPGRYAAALLHDENGNGEADMMLMLPKEGFGFSRNPAIRFGPPRFSRAAFAVDGGSVAQAIQMRYLL